MKKWEYWLLDWEDRGRMDELGSIGWELVYIHQGWLIFKRPVQKKTAKPHSRISEIEPPK